MPTKKTPSAIVVELQHSAMTDAERLSREDLCGNLVWVAHGGIFKQNFGVYDKPR